MRIAMFTNVYLPHVGGVARSVERFARSYRRLGHRTLVVAPSYEGQPEDEEDVVRARALQQFSGSDFSVVLPMSRRLAAALDAFRPEVIHSHHPFLIGNTALRQTAARDVPIVFTQHALHEHFTHYVPLELEAMKTYVIELSTGYANLCDGVVAPSESIAEVLRERGVTTPIRVVPTGVDLGEFQRGDGPAARRRHGIPQGAFVLGHVGRLAPEKNLEFLARAAARAMAALPASHALVVGDGECARAMEALFRRRGLAHRVHFPGRLTGQELVDAYHAMDSFAFASKADTQGMVLVEASATGCPIVALDAPGAREVVEDRWNGRLLHAEDEESFAQAITWMARRSAEDAQDLRQHARQTAARFTTERCARAALDFYRHVVQRGRRAGGPAASGWAALRRRMKREWDLWTNRAAALVQAVTPHKSDREGEEPA